MTAEKESQGATVEAAEAGDEGEKQQLKRSSAGDQASAAKKARLEPPTYSAGTADYAKADDGWWGHKGGEWLYHVEEKTYFHLPSGQLFMATDDGIVPMVLDVPDTGDSAEAEASTAAQRLKGRVKWFNVAKGYGFLEPLPGQPGSSEDVFIHRNQLGDLGDDLSVLTPGTLLSYVLGETDRGRTCAAEVQVEQEDDAAGEDGQGGDDEAGQEDEAASEDGAESEGSSVEVDLVEELHSGLHQDKGPNKEAIEDYASLKVQIPISVLGETATCVFFAVFDGHGGTSCAEYVSNHLAKNILSRLRDRAKNFSDEAALKTALSGGFKQTEHNFIQHAKKTGNTSGTTVCSMTVFGPDENMRLRLFTANVGDSRAVLGTAGGRAVRLTEDHKPDLPSEKKRIEANGGSVVEVAGIWRCLLSQKKWGVSKGLSLSRTMGDVEFKVDNIMSAEPDIRIHEVDWDADEFVILATDGVWDVVTDKLAVKLVRSKLHKGASCEEAGKALVDRARLKGSQDDCSALVVRFGWNKNSARPPEGEEEQVDDEEAAELPQAAAAEGRQDIPDKIDVPPPESEEADAEMDEDSDEDEDDEDNIFADGALPDVPAMAGTTAAEKRDTAPADQSSKDDDEDDEDDDDDNITDKLGKRLPLTKQAVDDGTGLFDGLQPPREEMMAPLLPAKVLEAAPAVEEPVPADSASKEAVDDGLDMFAS